MHNAPQLNCPFQTCKRHTGKGFPRQDNLSEHIRCRHTLHSDESKQARKRKVEAEWDQGVEEIKRLREDTRDLRGQLAAQDMQCREMMALIQQLQGNASSSVTDIGPSDPSATRSCTEIQSMTIA
jgi:hypothetical protein